METEIKEASIKEVLTVQKITEAEIRQMGREYNAFAWDKIIDRKAKLGADFYLAKADGKAYTYDRYFSVYKIEEGIIFFNQVSYSAGLSNRGFCQIIINDNGKVSRVLLKDANGNEGRCENDIPNRKIMAENSRKFGTIYSNNY